MAQNGPGHQTPDSTNASLPAPCYFVPDILCPWHHAILNYFKSLLMDWFAPAFPGSHRTCIVKCHAYLDVLHMLSIYVVKNARFYKQPGNPNISLIDCKVASKLHPHAWPLLQQHSR